MGGGGRYRERIENDSGEGEDGERQRGRERMIDFLIVMSASNSIMLIFNSKVNGFTGAREQSFLFVKN